MEEEQNSGTESGDGGAHAAAHAGAGAAEHDPQAAVASGEENEAAAAGAGAAGETQAVEDTQAAGADEGQTQALAASQAPANTQESTLDMDVELTQAGGKDEDLDLIGDGALALPLGGDDEAPSAQELIDGAAEGGMGLDLDVGDDAPPVGAGGEGAEGVQLDADPSATTADTEAPAEAPIDPSSNTNMANLFRQLFESDEEEEEEFQGFDEVAAPPPQETTTGKKRKQPSSGQSEKKPRAERQPESKSHSEYVELRKQLQSERSRSAKKDDSIDLTNKADENLEALIRDMQQALADDTELMQAKKPAIKRIQMLPRVVSTLRRADVIQAARDADKDSVLKILAVWLRPINGTLPNITLRNEIISLVSVYASAEKSILLESRIGQVCMTLMRHPEETRENKMRLRSLCDYWFRVIDSGKRDMKQVTSDERKQLEHDMQPTLLARRRSSSEGIQPAPPAATGRAPRPGEPGFIMRARVPQTTAFTYTVRPESSVKMADGAAEAKGSSLERRLRAAK